MRIGNHLVKANWEIIGVRGAFGFRPQSSCTLRVAWAWRDNEDRKMGVSVVNSRERSTIMSECSGPGTFYRFIH